jgi:hypothetical protein
MKKVIFVLSIVATCGLLLGACSSSGGPHCVKIVVCEPACEMTQWCDAGTCKDFLTCDPACTSPQVCNPLDGTCVDLPKECDPACTGGQYCDDGTCKDVPVCSPACAADEVCMP